MNSSRDPSLLADICEVNLSYLFLAQRLLREDLPSAMFRLGIDQHVAKLVQELSPTQLVRLASSSSLLCSLRLDDTNILSALRQDAPGCALHQEHMTILLATRPVQSWR